MAEPRDRAQRYPLAAPFRYRRLGEAEWSAGTTVNISSSGVLFVAESPIRPGMAIEVWFTLPPPQARAEGAEVVGSGFVVRSEGEAQPLRLAVRLHHYNLTRRAAGTN